MCAPRPIEKQTRFALFPLVSFLCAIAAMVVPRQVCSAQQNERAPRGIRDIKPNRIQALVTGDNEQLDSVVAGPAATLKFYFTPRPPLPGTEPSLAYPPGWNITGQKLTVSGGGFTSAWITQIEGWDSSGEGYTLLRSFQDKINAGGFKGANASPPNPGCDLVYPANTAVPCLKVCVGGIYDGLTCGSDGNCTGGACLDPCASMLGEPGPKCGATVAGFCDWGWQNTCGLICDSFYPYTCYLDCEPPGRADWVLAADPLFAQYPSVSIVSATGPIFAATTYPGYPISDAGLRYYTGTLVLPVPTCCKGTYTMGHLLGSPLAHETHAYDQASPLSEIPIAALIAGQLECQPGSCCTDFTSESSATCTPGLAPPECDALSSTNLHLFRPNSDCTTPCTVECLTDADCDDHLACTDDSCDANNHCVHTRTDDLCDDGVACTIDTCTEPIGTCAHALVDAACDDGLFCDGIEICTLTGCAPGEFPCGFGETCDETNDSCGLTPIPTVSQWGLATLTLLLLIAAKIGLPRRRCCS